MIEITYLKTIIRKKNATDQRAIYSLKWHILEKLHKEYPYISEATILDEENYIIVMVDGYENIAFYDKDRDRIYEIVQPIDKVNDKLYPIQTLELEVQYRRFYF